MTMKITDNSIVSDVSFFKSLYPLTYNAIADYSIKYLADNTGILYFPGHLGKSEDLNSKGKIFETRDNRIWTTNIVGFLGVGSERIEIKSRFIGDEDDYFLHYLLEKTMNINLTNHLVGLNKEESMYDLLASVFPYFLDRALSKGIYKSYKTVRYNDLRVKGRIDVAEHLAKNIPFRGNISYSSREYSLDNDVTQLIRHTIEFLLSQSNTNSHKLKASESIRRIIEVTPTYSHTRRLKVISSNLSNHISNTFYTDYIYLRKLCLMILQRHKHGLNSENNQIHGMIFDMSWLWEEYIYTLISNDFIHPDNTKRYLKQHLFNNDNDETKHSIYPDFIGINDYSEVIADAKYKPERNIKSSDYHQILSYVFRFNRSKGLFFHPRSVQSNDNKDKSLYILDGVERIDNGLNIQVNRRDPVVNIRNLSFDVPNYGYSTYEDYCKIMAEEEMRFVSKLDLVLDLD